MSALTAVEDDERDRAVLTDGIASIGAVIAGRRTYLEPLTTIQTPRATHLRPRMAR